MSTTVIHMRERRLGDVYIGRAGHGENGYFGNPYWSNVESARGAAIAAYRVYFYKRLAADEVFAARVQDLRGKRLVCFCKPKACHGDVIAEYLNALNVNG